MKFMLLVQRSLQRSAPRFVVVNRPSMAKAKTEGGGHLRCRTERRTSSVLAIAASYTRPHWQRWVAFRSVGRNVAASLLDKPLPRSGDDDLAVRLP